MNDQKKCSLKKHNEINAIFYCEQCNIYMCNKCNNHHSELHENHNKYEIGKENIGINLCRENGHKSEIKFYCKNHNKLCCGICITKIKGDGYGQHTDCEVYTMEKIADEKKNNLKDNIKYLEDISLNIDNIINEFKKIIIKIDENKEELKIKISKIFTKLRNAINNREDELLLDIDNKFNEFICDEKIIKQNEKLPNQIKEYLEKGKNIENEWKDNNKKINIFINDCINIENSIKIIKFTQQYIENFRDRNINVEFLTRGDNDIINNIKNFGVIWKRGDDDSYINNFDSLIINNNLKYNKTLKFWINQDDKIDSELLYRLTRDGDKISKFHELCDDKGPTLTLFCTNDENIGGIYTTSSWDTTSQTKYDKNAFMFNLNKNEKYKMIHNERSIWCTDYFGPWSINFGFNKTMKRVEHRGIKIEEGYEKGAEILPNNSEKIQYFDVKEVEIFKIIFINK